MSVAINPAHLFQFPAFASVFDAHQTLAMLLAGTNGDADPLALVDAAVAALTEARVALAEVR